MHKPNLLPFRILGLLHVVVGLLLLPLTLFFGFVVAPVLAAGPVWMVILGLRLWRPTQRVGVLLQWTHLAGAAIAAVLCGYGVLALQAAQHSAAAGGGLLGAFGLIPLGLGVLLGATAVPSLWLARRLTLADSETD